MAVCNMDGCTGLFVRSLVVEFPPGRGSEQPRHAKPEVGEEAFILWPSMKDAGFDVFGGLVRVVRTRGQIDLLGRGAQYIFWSIPGPYG